MSKTKKILLSFLFLILLFFYARYEYSWSDKIISNHKDWKVVTTDKTFYFIKPWTWFKQPIVTIQFIDNNFMGKYNKDIYFAHYKRISRVDDYIDNEKILMIDFKNKLFTSCSSYIEFSKLDENQLKELGWVPYGKHDNISKILEYIQKNIKTYSMINIFGEEIDITKYIQSKKYIVNTQDYNGFVPYVINLEPYEITIQDLKIIERDYTTWLKKHTEYTSTSTKINFNQIHYKESKLYYRNLGDIYTLENLVKCKGEFKKIKIEFSFSKQVFPQTKTENSIMFWQEN